MARTASITGDVLEAGKERFLEQYEEEHARTVRLLRAYPADKADLRPCANCRTAREIAWVFALERYLARNMMEDAYVSGAPAGKPPEAPDSWNEIVSKVEQMHREFAAYIRAMPAEQLGAMTKFMVGPKRMGDRRKLDLLWYLLHDEIHHRGQLSVYLRMAGGKVPSIYGPSGDEPWV